MFLYRLRIDRPPQHPVGLDLARFLASPLANDDWEDRTFSIMAGGDFALIKAVEGFEDHTAFGRKQIRDLGVREGDVVFAITEGGETSFVIGTAWEGVESGARVYFVYNNPDGIPCRHVERSRELLEDDRIQKLNLTTGPMAISGSTRMPATTIQLCVLVTVLEMVVRRMTGCAPGQADSVPRQFQEGLTALYQSLLSRPVLKGLASLVQAETSTYRSGGRTNYHAGHLANDVLTDTTERSPTFCTPPFRKRGDHGASESMAFLLVPGSRTVDAWAGLLQRAPRCLRWSPEEVQVLLPGSNPERTAAILEGITESELMRFAIGTERLEERALRSGDLSLTIRSDVDVSALKDHRRLDGSDHGSPAVGAVLHFTGHIEAGRPARGSTGHVPVPPAGLLLDGLTRVAVKMVLNAISTCVMVRLG